MSVKIEKTKDKIKGRFKNYGFEIDISNESRLDDIIKTWLSQIEKAEREMVE